VSVSRVPPQKRRRLRARRWWRKIPGLVGNQLLTPDLIAPLSGWWDARDDSTITENPAGSCESIDNKQAAVTLPKTYQQTGAAGTRPTLVTVSGHQMLFFQSANSQVLTDVQSNNVLQPGSGDFTIFQLFRAPAANNANGIQWRQEDAGGGTPFWSMRVTGSPGAVSWAMRDGTTTLVVACSDDDFADGSTRFLLIGMRDGADFRLFFGGDGVPLQEASTSPTAIPGGFGSVNAVNSALGNFPNVTAGFYWDGHQGEWGLYKSALDATQRAQLFQYFQASWDLS